MLLTFIWWGIIPFGQGLSLFDFPLGILYTLALSSLTVYGVLFAGWSANSKYAFLGSLRSTAAMISYELILSSAILIVIVLTGSFNFTSIIENQQAIWYIFPLLPVFIFYFISILAETSRTPFDLQEAESELVAGFFTEHSSIIFVFFFLGEYSSIVLFSCITSILFFGGYNMPELFVNDTFINLQAVILGIKTCVFCFLFVWVRATLPRLRYDQLISLCWLNLLPVAVALIILVPSILVAFDISPVAMALSFPVILRNNSTKSTTNSKLTDEQFAHWLAGFVDAEGYFGIVDVGNSFRFVFRIKLHIDDIKVLQFIQQRLGLGKINTTLMDASLTINKHSEIIELIKFLDIKNLNTTKYLNYLAFKEAFLLYFNRKSELSVTENFNRIRELKNSMNFKRTNYILPDAHKILITPYWLLGFTEGDGSFSISNIKGFPLRFNIVQVITEIKVLEAIRIFLLELPGSYVKKRINSNPVQILKEKVPKAENRRLKTSLNVNDHNFLNTILVPFFNNLIFLTKKDLDYKDWRTILELKTQGWHYSKEGADLITALLMRMNNHRLSNNGNNLSIIPDVNNINLDEKVLELLSRPSNFEVHPDGKIFIKSEKVYMKSRGNVEIKVFDKEGLLLNSFENLEKTSKFFNLSKHIIRYRLESGKPLILNNKEYLFKRSINP